MGLVSFSLCAGLLILIGLDLKISSARWKKGFKDLNPVVQFGVRNYGPRGGEAALLALNLSLMILLFPFTILLAILFGAKLGLATIQIRSLYEQHAQQSKQGRS